MDIEKEKAQKRQALKRGEIIHKVTKTAIFDVEGKMIMGAGQKNWRFKNPLTPDNEDEEAEGGKIEIGRS